MQISEESLEQFRINKADFVRRCITTGVTWVHYCTSETKERSKQWKHCDSPPAKKAMSVKFAG
ncbi:hypothetical protein WH47_08451 [Habropoda laboriosa]|uniref:Uncharacterized protein n=1 Tax=Habropoda laboriosa TaxID=597456 RepID=A0A0L7QPN2_9HYME|nr:hypothetical protein WH47_08451 [Habropoda laboriosa]